LPIRHPHAYAGAAVALARPERVEPLVYVTARAPDEGEKVAGVFYRLEPHPQAPKLAPDSNGLIWLPEAAFEKAFAQNASADDRAVLAAVQRPISLGCMVPTSAKNTRYRSRHRHAPQESERYVRRQPQLVFPSGVTPDRPGLSGR
jgi:hypothetical protein